MALLADDAISSTDVRDRVAKQLDFELEGLIFPRFWPCDFQQPQVLYEGSAGSFCGDQNTKVYQESKIYIFFLTF